MKIKIALLSFVMLAACGGEPAKTTPLPTEQDPIREKWRMYGVECRISGQSYDACIKMCDDEIAAQMPEEVLAERAIKEAIACHTGARRTFQ